MQSQCLRWPDADSNIFMVTVQCRLSQSQGLNTSILCYMLNISEHFSSPRYTLGCCNRIYDGSKLRKSFNELSILFAPNTSSQYLLMTLSILSTSSSTLHPDEPGSSSSENDPFPVHWRVSSHSYCCYHRRYRQVKMIQCRHTDIHSNLIIALQLMSCCWSLILLFSWDYNCFPLLLLDNNVCVLEAKPLHSSVYVSDNFFALIKTTGCETV